MHEELIACPVCGDRPHVRDSRRRERGTLTEKRAATVLVSLTGLVRGSTAGLSGWRRHAATLQTITTKPTSGGQPTGSEAQPRWHCWIEHRWRAKKRKSLPWLDDGGIGRRKTKKLPSWGFRSKRRGELVEEALLVSMDVLRR